MRFSDLFISYKIGLKGIKSTIPFSKLPLHRKVALIIFFTSGVTSVILFLLNITIVSCVTFGLGLLTIIIFIILDSMKRNLKNMLDHHYAPYSRKRMEMVINVLQSYGIDIHRHDSIDLLIEEAKSAQIQNDYLSPLKKPIKTLGAIIIPIIVYVAQKIGDDTTPDEIVPMALQVIVLIILSFSIILSIIPIIKEIFYFDYNKYNEFIYDLKQIKLFYAKDNTTSSN